MKILMATGIYPPDIGGPAKYAKSLEKAFRELGHEVKILAYRLEKRLPWGIRQVLYLVRIFFSAPKCDVIMALDTVSVGFPAVVASFLFGKRVIIRTGGDFLWESYVERTGLSLPLPYFYKIMPKLSFKENLIKKVHQFILDYTDFIVFSTEWQRDIWVGFYSISPEKIKIIENCYPGKAEGNLPKKKIFLAAARNIVMKNLDLVKDGFREAKKKIQDIELDAGAYPPDEYDRRLDESYAVVVASLGDISPNSIIEAVSHDKPFIITKYNGLKNRLGNAGVTVDPLSIKEIANAFIRLSDKKKYDKEVEKIKELNFKHSYKDIAEEFLAIINS